MSTPEERFRVQQEITDIQAERGVIEDAGACWVTFRDETQICYGGLDSVGCGQLQQRARVKTVFVHKRFCP